ncbi:GNAT family N-acetyltransferase [Kribbella sp. NBC_00709]|uniref:GNAT family N-acetyltransferase n=1 Tax=Kribbella sp. NBC_00709 TaxID=2975972 RepID=UPI003FA56EEE
MALVADADPPPEAQRSADPTSPQIRPILAPGSAGLGMNGDGTAEVGAWVAPAARGRGVAPQAVRAICRWTFDARRLDLIEWRAEVGPAHTD